MENKNKDQKTVGNKVGNMIEKLGHKIADAGAPNLGQKIHDLGDKMEETHKNPTHPHRV